MDSDGKTRLFELALSLRLIGKMMSVDRLAELSHKDSETVSLMEDAVRLLPLATGRMLVDLLDEEGMDFSSLRSQVWDPRSFRQAADAVERVAEEAPSSVHDSFHRLPESRWPQEAIKSLGLFAIGVRARGVDQVKFPGGSAVVSDVRIRPDQLLFLRDVLSGWHRAYASSSSSVPGEAVGAVTSLSPRSRNLNFSLVSSKVSPERAVVASQTLSIDDHQLLNESDQMKLRHLVVIGVHLVSKLLQTPFAQRFFRQICFVGSVHATSFVFPNQVEVSPRDGVAPVVEALLCALDASFGDWKVFASAESGPLGALSESISAHTGRPKTTAFHGFLLEYLQILWSQEGLVPIERGSMSIDIGFMKKKVPLLLDILLDEQRSTLRRWSEDRFSDQIEGFLSSGLGAAGVISVPALLPKIC